MTQLEQNIIEGLDDAAISRFYNRKRKAVNKAATITERLALWLFKVTALANFGLIMFLLGYFTTIYSDGILFEVPSVLSYWIDFGGAQ